MSADRPVSLWDLIVAAGDLSGRGVWGVDAELCLEALRNGSNLSLPLAEFRGKSVLLAIRDQFAGALAMIELDDEQHRGTMDPPQPEVAGVGIDEVAEPLGLQPGRPRRIDDQRAGEQSGEAAQGCDDEQGRTQALCVDEVGHDQHCDADPER